jgi:ABC-2 type transport system ATP-binding protein
MSAVVEATNLTKRYGRHGALRDLTLAVPGGRVVALVGPNGAGKTTFLQLAIGLQEPSAGRVSVFGLSPRRDAGHLLPRVGYVAQEPPLFRRFSVRELLVMGAHLNPRWDNGLAVTRLQQLGIGLDRSVSALSGGMRAQVALVLALAKRPELLLLDEPIAALDPLARHEFMQLLMEAAAVAGTTVVLSSHIIGDLRATCDHLVLLTGGQTRLVGGMDEIVAGHQRLVGPAQLLDSLAATHEVVQVRRTDRHAEMLVRTRGPLFDHRWQSYSVDLEQIVVAYLSRDSGRVGAVELKALEAAR